MRPPSSIGNAPPFLSGLYVGPDERRSAVMSTGLLPAKILIFPATDPHQAETFLGRSSVDFLLLDGARRLVDSLSGLLPISRRHGLPLVTLLPTADEAQRIWALENGADECVSRPHSIRELAARIRARVRRARGDMGPAAKKRIALGSLVLDPETLSAHEGRRRILLTQIEFRILAALIERPGRPLSREMLIALVQGSKADVLDRSIDVHIFRLRQKLGRDPREPRFIKTLRGGGYVAVPDDGA